MDFPTALSMGGLQMRQRLSITTEPPLTDLISYWKLDEASGTRNDSVGTNHLTDNNTVTQAAGKVGNAAQFTSANSEYLSIANNASLAVSGQSFTFAGWFYFDSSGFHTMADKTSGEVWLLFTRTSSIDLRVFDGGFTTVQYSYSQSTGTWYFVVAEFDSATKTVALDVNNSGSPVTAVTANQLVDNAGIFAMGKDQAGLGYLNGRADACGFWKRILTPPEKTLLYAGGAGLEYPF